MPIAEVRRERAVVNVFVAYTLSGMVPRDFGNCQVSQCLRQAAILDSLFYVQLGFGIREQQRTAVSMSPDANKQSAKRTYPRIATEGKIVSINRLAIPNARQHCFVMALYSLKEPLVGGAKIEDIIL